MQNPTHQGGEDLERDDLGPGAPPALAVAGYFAGALMDELERFLEWEKRRETVIPGHVIR